MAENIIMHVKVVYLFKDTRSLELRMFVVNTDHETDSYLFIPDIVCMCNGRRPQIGSHLSISRQFSPSPEKSVPSPILRLIGIKLNALGLSLKSVTGICVYTP